MANEDQRLKDLLESSLSQVEDFACSIRETTVQNIAPDNIKAVTQMNAALLSIEELAFQLENFVLMCKEKLKEIVPEAPEDSPEDDVDPDDVIPYDWSPPPVFDSDDAAANDELLNSDGSLRDFYDSDVSI